MKWNDSWEEVRCKDRMCMGWVQYSEVKLFKVSYYMLYTDLSYFLM
jgi:hypothetical protein